jgi:hypothetical protein
MSIRHWHTVSPNIQESVDRLFRLSRKPLHGQEVWSLSRWDGAEHRYRHVKAGYDLMDLKLLVEEMEWQGDERLPA